MDFEAHRTPNPNSLKVTTRRRVFIETGMESYRTAHEAAGHPLARSLFEVPGLSDVFMVPGFVTVTKVSDVSWDDIWPHIELRISRFVSGS